MQGVWYHNSFVDEPAWTSKNVEFNRRKNENTPGTASRKRVIFDNKHHSAFERSPKRRLCNTILGTTALSSSQPNAGLRFREELAPEEEEDLPVHAKKIEELKKWLISRMGVRVGSKTLLLTGPCGSGKTTAVKVLCAELGIEVVEYDGNQEYQVSYNGEEIYEKSMQKTFYQFMSSAECSSLEKMSLKQRLLLIKQLPNVFYRDQEILRKTLESCASSSRCIIAFVLSNNESCWELNPFRLFSNAIIDEFQIQQIKFNAVAATQMTRVVKNAACLLGLKMEKRPEDIKRIVSLANGDLRKTLNMMEFFVPGHPSSMNLLSAADAHFDLFHFIGKIMYAKRATTSTDSWARSEDKLIRKARKKTRILPPKEDINELTSSNFISGKFLSNYIFEHEPSFAPSVKTLKSVQSNLCVFDACFSGDLEIYPLLDRYMLEVATRSAIYHNYQDSSTGSDVRKGKGLYQFGKPKFKPIIERRDAKEQLIRDVFPCSNICDMKMLTLPIAEVIFGKLHYTADKNMLENEEMNRKKLERLKSFIFPEPNCRMSVPPSRAQSEVLSSQFGGGLQPHPYSRYTINYFLLPNFIIHVVGLACLWALWYYLRFTTVFPYHHRVFYCRDVLLYKPNFQPEDFEVYVSYSILYILAFSIPIIVILIGEVMFWLFSTKPRKIVVATCGECRVHLITRRLFRFICVFLFGALVTQIFVDTIKLLTGYQRPYFLSLCNVSLPACTAPLEHSPSPSPHLACLYKNADDLRYAWLTFPSLHAAFSSYSACFASCYIYYMINLRGAPLLRPMLIFGFIGMALVDSFSRINGYKNHWRDIWVGWLIGFLIAIFLCHCVLCFQEVYHVLKPALALTEQVEEQISPFFSWFRLPRVHAPSVKEEYVVYEEEVPMATTPAGTRHRRNQDRTYEVTTTTESFHRTIKPPNGNGTQQRQPNGYQAY